MSKVEVIPDLHPSWLAYPAASSSGWQRADNQADQRCYSQRRNLAGRRTLGLPLWAQRPDCGVWPLGLPRGRKPHCCQGNHHGSGRPVWGTQGWSYFPGWVRHRP